MIYREPLRTDFSDSKHLNCKLLFGNFSNYQIPLNPKYFQWFLFSYSTGFRSILGWWRIRLLFLPWASCGIYQLRKGKEFRTSIKHGKVSDTHAYRSDDGNASLHLDWEAITCVSKISIADLIFLQTVDVGIKLMMIKLWKPINLPKIESGTTLMENAAVK